MDVKTITPDIAVGPQLMPSDMAALAAAGFRSVIDNRPDGEGPDQPTFREIADAAAAHGLTAQYLPIVAGTVTDEHVAAFEAAMAELPKPVFAYCRSGNRSTTLWALSQAGRMPVPEILMKARDAGYDMSSAVRRIAGADKAETAPTSHDIVVIGGGAAGISVAASLLHRDKSLDIAIIEPSDIHYYQPGWTLVGSGVFDPETTRRNIAAILPEGAKWIKAAVVAFEPENNAVVLESTQVVTYKRLIVAPGLKLNWNGIEGLAETLGQNGVTSNYRYDLAPYTWKLVNGLKQGKAIFTQPPMPIKCAGAPQKAMYLSADHWRRAGHLKDIDIGFYNAGGVLFGVDAYVPALMEYVKRYDISLNFNHNLVRIDGPAKTAWFTKTDADGNTETVETSFDMIHVCPPQEAPDFIRVSPLADAAGWADVDPQTLRHTRYNNIYALGDVGGMSNAKTAAAARKQAPVVAENVLHDMGKRSIDVAYDGYGSCPLTVERGKIILAEFGYGGKLLPTFPSWLIDGTKPSRMAWYLKERILPPVYWRAMLKGREYMAKPEKVA